MTQVWTAEKRTSHTLVLPHRGATFTRHAPAAAAMICAALLSWRGRSVVLGIVVIGTVSAAALASTTLKAVVDRPRPPMQWQLVVETDPSFPSGHVTGTGALLGIIAVCVGVGRTRTVRAWLTGGVVAAVVVIAATRLYLGVHWLSDVAAGAVLAMVFVTIGSTVLAGLNDRSGQRDVPPVAADRHGVPSVRSRDIGDPHPERTQ